MITSCHTPEECRLLAAGMLLVYGLPLHFVATTPRSEHVRFAPFFVGGVSYFSNPQNDSYLGFVIGLGSNVWIGRHVALRLDGRIPFLATSGGGGTAGIGITLR